ncbi:MAG: inorganic pyrophosphatase [Labilithrix sp.]|nr:inorganic pyrophosphatase [Labilithrix sp.]
MATRQPGLDQLPTWDDEGKLTVVVESPRGSGVKLKYEPELGVMTLSRPLPLGLVFPFEFGFVPRTRAEDGDPLDAAVLLDVPTYPGVVLHCRPIGVLRASQKGEKGRVRNDRLVTIAEQDRRRAHVKDLGDLAARERAEIERFFDAAVALEGKDLELLGWGDARAARAAVEASRLPRRSRSRRRA